MEAAIVGSDVIYNEENLLEIFKTKAKDNCKQCMGRGHTGYIDEIIPKKHKNGEEKERLRAKFYYPCSKCFKQDENTLYIKW